MKTIAKLLGAMILAAALATSLCAQQLVGELKVQQDVWLQSNTPATTAARLYNVGGTLYWAGAPISPGGSPYVLPVATVSQLGGVKQGSNVTIAGDGTISVPATAFDAYNAAAALAATLGTASTYNASAFDPAGAAAAVTPTTLGLVIGTNTQAHSAKLDTFSALADGAGWLHSNGSGTYAWSVPAISDIFSAAQAANAIYAGPASGAAAAPGFRAMVAADLGTTLTPQFGRVGIGAAADSTILCNVAGLVYATSPQIGTVRGITGAENSTQYHLIAGYNSTPFSGDASGGTMNGLNVCPVISSTNTTTFTTVAGVRSVPQIMSSSAGARLGTSGAYFASMRNQAADLSAYASNSLTGLTLVTGHNAGLTAGVVTGTVDGANIAIYNYNGTQTLVEGVVVAVAVGSAGQNPNPVVGTYYALRLKAPTLANGGSITAEWGISQESTTASNQILGYTGIGITASSSTALNLSAGTTGVSSLRIAHGAAPTAPVNGDVWSTTAGFYGRVNGVTVGPWGTGGSATLTSAHLFVGNGSNVATDVALSGDATITNAGVMTITGLKGTAVPSLSTGYLYYNGSAFAWNAGTGSVSAHDPTVKVGLAVVNGSAATFMRSDAAPALDTAIAPTWSGNHIFNSATNGVGDGLHGPIVGQAPWHINDGVTVSAKMLATEDSSVPCQLWSKQGNALQVLFSVAASGSQNYCATIRANRAHGTMASPTAVQAGGEYSNYLQIEGAGYDGTNMVGAAAITMGVDGTVATGSVPSCITFVTGKIWWYPGSGTETARFTSNRNFLVGTTSETGLTGAGGLSVASATDATSSTAGAIITAGGVAAAKQIRAGTSITAGTSIVATTGFGCNSKAAQTAYASGGAAPAGGTGTAAGGWDTAAHRDSAITLLNNIRSALVADGIMN